MKTKLEIIPDLDEEEIIIRVRQNSEAIEEILAKLNNEVSSPSDIRVYKRETEYFLNLQHVLFFETQNDAVFVHTRQEMYTVKQRLFELEAMLPTQFLRISKSSIVNCDEIQSIARNLTASSLIEFKNSFKQIYVSRLYFKQLKLRLDERRLYEN